MQTKKIVYQNMYTMQNSISNFCHFTRVASSINFVENLKIKLFKVVYQYNSWNPIIFGWKYIITKKYIKPIIPIRWNGQIINHDI